MASRSSQVAVPVPWMRLAAAASAKPDAPVRVPVADGLQLGGRGELLQPELPDRFQQGVAGAGVSGRVGEEQALVEQGGDPFQDVSSVVPSHRRGGFQGEASGEDRQRAKEALLLAVEEVVAPGDRRPHRAQPLRQVGRAATEQRQAAVEPGQQRLRREERQARRRQLDGQGQAIDPAHDAGDGDGILRAQVKIRIDLQRLLHEEADGGVLRERGGVTCFLLCWRRQRRDAQHALAAQAQPLPAGDEHLEIGAGAQEVGEERGRRHDGIEAIEQEHDLLAGHLGAEGVDQVRTFGMGEVERQGDGRQEERGIVERGQADEADGVGELLAAGPRRPGWRPVTCRRRRGR